MGHTATALALQKWAPFLYPDKGQKKYREVVIHPFGEGPVKPTGWTSPGMILKSHCFGLNTRNEKKHEVFLTWSTGFLES